MGRLIDADALIARTYEAEKNVAKSSDMAKMVMDTIRNEVNNQPTAYDVEKVVEELKALHKSYNCTDNEFQRGAKAGAHYILNRALALVRNGGKE